MSDSIEFLSSKLHKINSISNEIENLSKNIELTGKSAAKCDLISRKEQEASAIAVDAHSLLTSLIQDCRVDQTLKVRVDTLKAELRRVLSRLQKAQAGVKRLLTTTTPTSDPAVGTLIRFDAPATDHDEEMLLPGGSSTLQRQLQEEQNLNEMGRALEEEEQMRLIEDDIQDVHAIFTKISANVSAQHEMVDNLEENIESAYEGQEAATVELQRAAISRQRRRKRCCICWIVLTIISAVVTFILVMVYYRPSKAALQ